jgi:hypothetical protein
MKTRQSIIVADVSRDELNSSVDWFFRTCAVEWHDATNLAECICRIQDVEDIPEYNDWLSPEDRELIQKLKASVNEINACYIRII